MPRLTINLKLIPLGLSGVDTNGFERFGQAFYAAVMGRTFVPLGGMHDGGAEGYIEPELFEDPQAVHFLQVSKQKTYRIKISGTVKRLRTYGRNPQSVVYLTSQTVGSGLV